MMNEFNVNDLPMNMNADFSLEDERPYWTSDEVRDQHDVIGIPQLSDEAADDQSSTGEFAQYKYCESTNNATMLIYCECDQLLATYDLIAVKALLKLTSKDNPPTILLDFLEWAELQRQIAAYNSRT